MTSLKGEQEREKSSQIFAPARKAATSNDQWLLKQSIHLCSKLGIDELGKWIGGDVDRIPSL
ncbi:uncharacterized protein N7469_002239 [Penicillium citrinum]|uniref:Uncharacterized protein n=1 Tax=Penicillium citrinum TaxID=5077 RepID=A0A9W9PA25_PENCI|nr:uncharacterized protein N7469_002239 [Penicillium citrinum]KAJ5240648.1 hypothetical protein N7469_002239 [Penicillium citrinum]